MNKFGDVESLKAAAQNKLIDFLSIDITGFVCGHGISRPVALAQFDCQGNAVGAVTRAGWRSKTVGSELRYVRVRD